MPEDMPDRVPEDMPEQIAEDMPARMPEDMPDRVPEDMPEQIAEDMPARMPEDMPDRMPEDMPDKMPEDMPVTKCINVMVRITRSKVFFYRWNQRWNPLISKTYPSMLSFYRKTWGLTGQFCWSLTIEDWWFSHLMMNNEFI